MDSCAQATLEYTAGDGVYFRDPERPAWRSFDRSPREWDLCIQMKYSDIGWNLTLGEQVGLLCKCKEVQMPKTVFFWLNTVKGQ